MFFDNPVIASITIGLPSFLLGYLAYRRSVRADKISEQSGIASNKTEGIAQALDGMNKLVVSLNAYILLLQADSAVDKEDIKILTIQRDTLQKELNRMYKKYGENGNGKVA